MASHSLRKRDGTILTWTGRAGYVCTHCERAFAGVTAFDRHLIRRGQVGAARHAHPADVGLHLDSTGKWSATDAGTRTRLQTLSARRPGVPSGPEGSEQAGLQATERAWMPESQPSAARGAT